MIAQKINRLWKLSNLVLIVGIFVGGNFSNAWAQIALQYSGPEELLPTSYFSVAQTKYSSQKVDDSSGFQIGKSAIQTTEDAVAINLIFANILNKARTLHYEGFESESTFITTENYNLRKTDLPTKLYQESVGINFPIILGEGVLAIGGGRTLASDKEEIKENDFVSFFRFTYLPTPSESSSLIFGMVHSSGFGRTVNFPVIGYQSKNLSNLEVEITFPSSIEVRTSFASGWTVELAGNIEQETFRLTDDEPWSGAILSTSRLKSSLGFTFHLGGFLLFSAEGGYLSDNQLTIQDKVSSGGLGGGESDPLLEMALEDGSYLGFSLSLAFGGSSGKTTDDTPLEPEQDELEQESEDAAEEDEE